MRMKLIFNIKSVYNAHQARLLSDLSKHLSKMALNCSFLSLVELLFSSMLEIASFSIMAASFSKEHRAVLCFIEAILLIILAQFMRSMGKLAFVVVRAISILHEFLA